jgi:hypothetical protein
MRVIADEAAAGPAHLAVSSALADPAISLSSASI